jgi:hypothetical protein
MNFYEKLNEVNCRFENSQNSLTKINSEITSKFSSEILEDIVINNNLYVDFYCSNDEYKLHQHLSFILRNSDYDLSSKNDWKSFININCIYGYGGGYFAVMMINKWFLFLLFDII